MKNFFDRIYRIITSLKLGVPVILGLMTAMIAGTLLESQYDTATAKFWVYNALWFRIVLIALAVNIAAVMVDRWPWKRRHLPFLCAHIGILTLLTGAWITDKFGLDGMMRIEEGQTETIVELAVNELKVSDLAEAKPGNTAVRRFEIPWTPPHASFRAMELPGFPVRVVDYMAHADARVEFSDAESAVRAGTIDLEDLKAALPAVKVRLKALDQSFPMARVLGKGADFWLWSGDPGWSKVSAGPALLALETYQLPALDTATGQPVLKFSVDFEGGISWQAISSTGVRRSGKFKAGQTNGAVIETGWKGDIVAEVLEYYPRSHHETLYSPSKIQWGNGAAPSAVQIQAGKSTLWLGLGDRASLSVPAEVSGGKARELSLVYQPHRIVLPYGIRLKRFVVEHYQGTLNPMEYSSLVEVLGGPQGSEASAPTLISMNEPLKHKGITFYQASYEDAQPRPTVTILSVNRDPGRPAKYAGSLILVLGCVFLFFDKSKKKRAVAA